MPPAALLDSDDPFVVLGSHPNASESELRVAYNRLVKQYPPDRAPDQFARIHAALNRALGAEPPPWLPPPLTRLGGDGLYERLVAHLDDGDYGALWRDADAAALSPEVAEDPEIASAVLRALGVCAWHTPNARPLVDALLPIARAHGLGELHHAVWIDGAMANGYYRFGGVVGPAAAPLLALFGDPLLASPARRRAISAEVVPLLDDPRVVLEACDRIAFYDIPLARRLAQRLQRESPLWNDRALAPLPDEVRAQLLQRLEAVRDPLRRRRIGFGVLGGAVGVGLSVVAVSPGPMVVGALIAAVGYGSQDKHYRRHIKPRLAGILAELGVQADTVTAWMRARPAESKQLRPYVTEISWDVSLMLFGAIAAIVREHARAPREQRVGAYR